MGNIARSLTLLMSCALLAATGALGQEFKPHPKPRITEAQWQAYFDEVKEKHGATVQDIDSEHLLVFTNAPASTVYAFTKPSHPAHPAWIARKPEQRGDSVYVGQIGYFAGAEPPFAKLFRDYLALNEKMKADLQRGRPQGEK